VSPFGTFGTAATDLDAFQQPGWEDRAMNDSEFMSWLTAELGSLPSVVAVALGGSRAQQRHHPNSDWDFAVYYRDRFDPGVIRAKGWVGEVSEVGGWGGGVMNGGAWLTIDGRRVDVHYRDLNEVEHWCSEAQAGRFRKELLLFYAAGIPTYVVMAELALHVVLVGELPKPEYPEALARAASRRWLADAIASLRYGEVAFRERGDVTVAMANTARGIIEAAHGRLAERKEWVLNEKGIADRAGLASDAEAMLSTTDLEASLEAIGEMRSRLEAQGRSTSL
jgi:predicted nucleotidyltransferase